MEHKELDKEYYVMNIGGEDNYPILAWGSSYHDAFSENAPIDKELPLPLKIVFTDPFPEEYEMADFLMLGSNFAGSANLKNLFDKNNIYGVQFFPVEIKSNKGEIISGHYAIHFWNKYSAIDKDNYEGEEIDEYGYINDLEKFSLDLNLLNDIPLEKRLVFGLSENPTMILVHESIYSLIEKANLTGLSFFRVDEWDEDAMFR